MNSESFTLRSDDLKRSDVSVLGEVGWSSAKRCCKRDGRYNTMTASYDMETAAHCFQRFTRVRDKCKTKLDLVRVELLVCALRVAWCIFALSTSCRVRPNLNLLPQSRVTNLFWNWELLLGTDSCEGLPVWYTHFRNKNWSICLQLCYQ